MRAVSFLGAGLVAAPGAIGAVPVGRVGGTFAEGAAGCDGGAGGARRHGRAGRLGRRHCGHPSGLRGEARRFRRHPRRGDRFHRGGQARPKEEGALACPSELQRRVEEAIGGTPEGGLRWIRDRRSRDAGCLLFRGGGHRRDADGLSLQAVYGSDTGCGGSATEEDGGAGIGGHSGAAQAHSFTFYSSCVTRFRGERDSNGFFFRNCSWCGGA